MIKVWLFLLNNKTLALTVGAIIAVLIWVMALRNDKAQAEKKIYQLETKNGLDSIKIIVLQREVIDLKADTAQYRADIKIIETVVRKLRELDARESPGLSQKYPTLEELKKKK